MPQPIDLYGQATLEAMNDIAELILITRSLREISKQFRKEVDIDFCEAKPRAVRILESASEAAHTLLDAALDHYSEEKLIKQLGKARREHLALLTKAASAARLMAEQEDAAYESTPLKSFIRPQVQIRLEALVARWKATTVTGA
jgi:hypothetical protein